MIQLYHRWHCPYSARVRDFIDEHKLGSQIKYLELGEAQGAATNLATLAGQSQVPCLVVDGKPILESAEIVQWLKKNLVNSEGSS